MNAFSRFPGTTLDEDRDAMRHARQVRMEAAHKRIDAALDRLKTAAWDDIQEPETASESEVAMAEQRADRMERNIVLRAGWSAAQ